MNYVNLSQTTQQEIQALLDEYESKDELKILNEAATRLLIIDRILISLGWERNSFHPEEFVGMTGYTDYKLEVDEIPRLIVEAKKAGNTFTDSRQRLGKESRYKLGYLRSQFGQLLTDVIQQAERYCFDTGVPFAVLTNGLEWFVIQASHLPVHVKKNELFGIYFGNIFQSTFRLDYFCYLLHKSQVAQGILEEEFASLNPLTAEQVLVAKSQLGPLLWAKPSDETILRNFYEDFFGEIIDHRRRHMLERCFVTNATLDQYRSELGRALVDTTPAYIKDAKSLSPGEAKQEILSTGGKGQVILVTGSVGCGKSTLVAKVIQESKQIDRSSETVVNEKSRTMFVSVNLIHETDDEFRDVEAYLWKKINEEWFELEPASREKEHLTKMFGRELSTFEKGEYADLLEINPAAYVEKKADYLNQLRSDPETFFKACWEYYQKRHRRIIIFFDNVDQTSEAYQKKVYSFAHRIADNTGVTVIITMREVKFFRHQDEGFLNIRSNSLVFHLQSPTLEQVLASRIHYIQNNLDDDPRLSTWKRESNWSETRFNFESYAEALKVSFLQGGNGRQILGLLDAVSWHNVRQFLRILRDIHIHLGSTEIPWETTDTIAALIVPTELGSIPILQNIYRPSAEEEKGYFLKLRLLIFLIYGMQRHEVARGVHYERLRSFALKYGYRNRLIEQAIEELVQGRLIECIVAPTSQEYTKSYSLDYNDAFRRSPLGIVMVEQICTEPVYLSLIGNDLPFHKQPTFKNYLEQFGEFIESVSGEMTVSDVEYLASGVVEVRYTIATYLVEALEYERPAQNVLKADSEINLVERKLEEIISQLRGELSSFYGQTTYERYMSSGSQPILPGILGQVDDQYVQDVVPEIPENILDTRIGRSQYAPVVFWSLVYYRLNHGEEYARGFEICNIMNTYLYSEDDQKAEPNVSRALRSESMMEQEWLEWSEQQQIKYFRIVPNWRDYWIDIFGNEYDG